MIFVIAAIAVLVTAISFLTLVATARTSLRVIAFEKAVTTRAGELIDKTNQLSATVRHAMDCMIAEDARFSEVVTQILAETNPKETGTNAA